MVTYSITDALSTFYLHKYPFMRLIIPWITGVFCGDCFFDSSPGIFWVALAFCLFFGLSMTFYFLQRYSLRWCFGVTTFALCITGGWMGITWQLQQTMNYTFPEEEAVYRILITDTPQIKEHTYLCRALLKGHCDSIDTHPIEQKVILYLQQDSAVSRLRSGDELLVSARISPPANNKNFDEFDYARYLMRKGISGTGYVASGKWTILSSDLFSDLSSNLSPSGQALRLSLQPDRTSKHNLGTSLFYLRNIANSYREKIISLYRELGFNGDELAVLSALTIGDKTELSESARESYSVAGASHILALSGLHIGLLYVLLFFILQPVAKRGNTGRCLRSLFLIILLWAFAFFTGFSPSVVRSVTMFSVLALADMFGRQSFSLNTLAATAWLMLLCNPAWLFDVGFQLSFVAVTSILLIQQPIYHLFTIKSRIGKYVWGLMSVSIAAQLGTAPLVIFYFSRFSTHFLLTNLAVIPLVTIILYVAVFMLLLTPVSWIQIYVAGGVKKLLEILNLFVRWVEQLPYSSINGIWLYQLEVFGIYVFLLLLFYYYMNRRYKNLITCLSFILLLAVCHVTMSWIDRPQSSLVFYNVRGCPAVHCIESDGHSWINYADTLPDKQLLKRAVTNYWNHRHLLPPKEITADYKTAAFSRQQQILSWQGCRICMVTDNRWRNNSTDSALYTIDYLYLCKGYDGHLEELTRLFVPGCILLDASLSEYRKNRLEDECKQSGLRFISLSEEGSVCFLL